MAKESNVDLRNKIDNLSSIEMVSLLNSSWAGLAFRSCKPRINKNQGSSVLLSAPEDIVDCIGSDIGFDISVIRLHEEFVDQAKLRRDNKNDPDRKQMHFHCFLNERGRPYVDTGIKTKFDHGIADTKTIPDDYASICKFNLDKWLKKVAYGNEMNSFDKIPDIIREAGSFIFYIYLSSYKGTESRKEQLDRSGIEYSPSKNIRTSDRNYKYRVLVRNEFLITLIIKSEMGLNILKNLGVFTPDKIQGSNSNGRSRKNKNGIMLLNLTVDNVPLEKILKKYLRGA